MSITPAIASAASAAAPMVTRLESLVSKLPQEVIQRTFHQAGLQSVQNLAVTSKVILPIITKAASDINLSETKNFIQGMIDLLTIPSQIEPLSAILLSLEHAPFPALLHLKQHLLDIKERVIIELMKLDKVALAS